MSEETLRTLILALLGTGGATFIWTVVRSIIAYQNSAEGREDKAVARLEKFEENCREQLAHERKWGSHWQHRSATLEYLLRSNGIDVPVGPLPPEPPKGLSE